MNVKLNPLLRLSLGMRKQTHLFIEAIAVRSHPVQITLTRQRFTLFQYIARHIHQPPYAAFFAISGPFLCSEPLHRRGAGQPAIRVQQHYDLDTVVYETTYYFMNSHNIFVKILETWRGADGRERDDCDGEVGALKSGCEGLVVSGCVTGAGDDNDGREGHLY